MNPGPRPPVSRASSFRRPEDGAVHAGEEPDYFGDLNLDQVLHSMTSGREEYQLSPFFYSPLHDVAAVRYRHEVLRDLERPEVLDTVTRFAERMTQMRAHLDQAEHLNYELQRQAWFVDAVEVYCDAVRALADDLASRQLGSEGLNGLCGYLAEYVASPRFTSLVDETSGLREAFGAIRYSVLIQGGRVTVTEYAGDADYSAQVQDDVRAVPAGDGEQLPGDASRREGDEPRRGADSRRRGQPPQRGIRETRGLLRPTRRLPGRDHRPIRSRGAVLRGLPRADRSSSGGWAAVLLPARFDAVKGDRGRRDIRHRVGEQARAERRTVVGNDLYLEGPERMFVVSGPNNGGKTTFARAFGQLHHLAGLGLLVPGREARLFLPDRIYTHFEKEEDIRTLRGKFEDELVRVHGILDRATASSVIVMNESFNSTTLNDALFVGSEVMRRILELGCLGVYVTFVDELASLSEATVSMVTQIVPDNPAVRTFKVLRQPADGLAYAWAIAEKYGLTYERVIERIGT